MTSRVFKHLHFVISWWNLNKIEIGAIESNEDTIDTDF